MGREKKLVSLLNLILRLIDMFSIENLPLSDIFHLLVFI